MAKGWLRTAMACLAVATAWGAAAQDAAEYRVKAAFLFNFARFVEWPAGSFATAQSPIVVASLCPRSFAEDLAQVVNGKRIRGRPLDVRTVEQPPDVRPAHVVFFCRSHDVLLPGTIGPLRRLPVLTVGESDSFAQAGGMIRFVIVDDRVRFEVDMLPVERAGLSLSAQLQKLALSVRRSP